MNGKYVLVNKPTDPMDYSKLKAAQIVHHEPKKNSNGGSSVSYMVKKEGEEFKLYIQFPKLKCPFGKNNYNKDGRDNLSVQVSLDPDHKSLRKLVDMLDDTHIAAAKENLGIWFPGAKIPPSAIDALYKRAPVEPKPEHAGKYAPTMRLKINSMTSFFDEKRQPATVDALVPGCEIIALVEVSMIWFINRSFSPSYTLVQAKVFNSRSAFTGYAIEDSDDEMDM